MIAKIIVQKSYLDLSSIDGAVEVDEEVVGKLNMALPPTFLFSS